ncbi:MAG: UDP-N-acetylmuramoyl-tripeptide--D-alanyl-D-alanine ligase [Gammaproteobacteria bacterium]|jgi:UDP-N-acetylmuramoyl-tripeptide--D-alanyl-D-alanine ligase|nr:UDP-N-acetylmuramoyl-tripeptide--D-alanyl-D-alanine ligase [Gammaproteobacteria bacterium]MBT3725554.1 UDP-N-acetylmuramoyl-tripeptide--D-alanyl-D-alanine ligase [Gammaproteobacteria bacterium]MBT4077061.1 UDP-N-acetylmuramoyl-tripeptide--D-alanyl-D-alanine ligase [Gammaproteobacteria bacterium]MBT4193330.1 UDP-N-acetylmuramoyl-tripeptide--D-alanyl-D-alanine ligase [Gammaproteobacteria bacterium]MBT4449150.1 UDP-N-acetylmuramoyl-tripeptide--D-alanyl-D-alanine ligase [Gammaproteobacteria bact
MIHMDSPQLMSLFPQRETFQNEFSISSVIIDSRKSVEGCLFVAIKGDNFDGHQYVNKAAELGAVAAIVETVSSDISIPQILVQDTRQALALLANFWRKKVNPVVVAITGSNGKTTVKEMLGRILTGQGQTLMTAGNFNNEIGVPLTLFRLSEGDSFAVIEMGANHQHEISKLMHIAEPDVVYVNNARAAHIEGFGSLEMVVKAKGEMYQYCKADSFAVFNDDEDSSDYWKSISTAESQLIFSSVQSADLTGKGQSLVDGLKLIVEYQQQSFECIINVFGKHNIQNSLAAITLAIACGLTLKQACKFLSGFSGVKGRQQFLSGVQGSVIIDDSYNANPDSLKAAVNVLCALKGTAWLALGDMAEMGEQTLLLHQQAANEAKQAGVEQFFALGEMSCKAADVFDEDGFCFSQHSEMVEFISPRLHKGINLLVKGSRSAGMDKVVEKLILNAKHSDVSGVEHAL